MKVGNCGGGSKSLRKSDDSLDGAESREVEGVELGSSSKKKAGFTFDMCTLYGLSFRRIVTVCDER